MTVTPCRLRLKITLEGSEPAIWRRVEVNDNLTFFQLHRVIQQAMGWGDYHLHEFDVARQRVGTRSAEDAMFMERDEIIPERSTRLGQLLGRRRKFRYWYDFGDDWWHTIAVEKHLPADPAAAPAQLVAGENACPPEDCGGIWGYADLLDTLRDPASEGYADACQWIGDDFDPTAFDLAAHAKRVAATVRKAVQAKKDAPE